MIGQRDPRTQVHDEKPAGVLGDRHRFMFNWYKGMIDESAGRVLYLYDPVSVDPVGLRSDCSPDSACPALRIDKRA